MPVTNVTPGVVRNLLKTSYYLRIPRQEVNKTLQHDRQSSTIELKPNIDVILFWKDFDAVEDELNRLDRDNIVRIIRRPKHLEGVGADIEVEKDGIPIVTSLDFLNFHGAVSITNEGLDRAGITVLANNQGIEIPFTVGDWSTNQLTVIPTGVPAAGQIGPHLLPVVGKEYVVDTFKTVGVGVRVPVGLDTTINTVTGIITLRKAPIIPSFSGVAVISLYL